MRPMYALFDLLEFFRCSANRAILDNENGSSYGSQKPADDTALLEKDTHAFKLARGAGLSHRLAATPAKATDPTTRSSGGSAKKVA